MKIGIIGAMEQELELLKKNLSEFLEWEEAGVKFYSGTLKGHEVIVTQSGIGKVLAAMTATLLLSRYNIDVLINTGSAGGIGTGLKIGDVVISDQLAYFDADVTAFGYEYGQLPKMPLFYQADDNLLMIATQSAKEQQVESHIGLIVSGDTFVHSKDQIDHIKQYFPTVAANEMEGAAIAQVSYQYQVPFVVIRAISDVGDENASVNFDEFIIEAGQRSAKMVLAILEKL